MQLYFLLFTVPILSMVIGGVIQVWDEMFGNVPQEPIENMGRPTAKVEFGLVQPILARSVCEPLGLRAEAPMVRRQVREDSTIAPLIVVGDFSVLGPLTEVAAATARPLPAVAPPAPHHFLVPAWLESGMHEPVEHN